MAQRQLNFLITGAARGIGRGLTRHLNQRGHRVFLVDNDGDELKHTVASLPGTGVQTFSSCQADLRSPADIKSAASAAADFFDGHLDVLVSNAAATGMVGKAPFAELSLEDWNAQLEVNLTAPMLLSQLCLPMLRAGAGRHGEASGGSIIFMSSTRARQSEPHSEGYAATKAGLVGLTHALACSLAPMGITVNAILPGWINVANECAEGDRKGAAWGDGLSGEDHKWHFSGRVGKVEDVVSVVELLAQQRFINGQEIVLDGGVSRKMVYPEE